MKHICENCMYKYSPESMHDYFKKTFTYPETPEDWGKDYRKQLFFLCSNPNIAKIDHTDDSLIYKLCREHNFNGECQYYREENAIDIEPAETHIEPAEDMTVKKDEEVTLTASTEETENKVYFQWYKNGRKLYKETKAELKVNTSKAGIDIYACIITQGIEDNGDGGDKYYSSITDGVTVTIEEDEPTEEESSSDL